MANGAAPAGGVVAWSVPGAKQEAKVGELVGRRGLSMHWIRSAAELVIHVARCQPRLVLLLEPEGPSDDWRSEAAELRRVLERRFASVRCMTLPSSGGNGQSTRDAQQGESDEGVVLVRSGLGREKVSPVLVHVPDPERLRPPEITQDELRMLLGPYPDEERA